jgi:glycosyltransferase involved in cell wall biosynthesis
MSQTQLASFQGEQAEVKRPNVEVACEFELTILMPCLDEAETLATCIRKATGFLARTGISGEVLIADNGSTDGSRQIAEALGARVILVQQKGYGAALMAGIEAARGQYTIMGDADDSYDFASIDQFIDRLRGGADLVMGNRFKGIQPGAMPVLHRYLGNPLLSFIGRLFFRVPVSDLHCGLRGFNTAKIRMLGLQTTGMEFASEMIVRSVLAGFSIAEVPITLHPDGRSRAPHLRTWRDGWRHLKFLLMYSPTWLYLVPGFLLLSVGLILAFALLLGPLKLANIVLDLNTLLVACCLAIAGAQLVTFGALSRYFAVKSGFLPSSASAERMLRWSSTDRILQLGGVLFVLGLTAFGYAMWSWARLDFGNLFDPFIPRILMLGLTGMVIGIQIAFAAFFFGIFDIGHMSRAQPHG